MEIPQEMMDLLYWLAMDLFIIAAATVALVTTAKHAAQRLHGEACLEGAWTQFALEFGPLLVGALLGVLPGLLDDYPFALRAVFGLVAGFMSPTLYGYVKRRWPNLMLSKDAEQRSDEALLNLIDPDREVPRG